MSPDNSRGTCIKSNLTPCWLNRCLQLSVKYLFVLTSWILCCLIIKCTENRLGVGVAYMKENIKQSQWNCQEKGEIVAWEGGLRNASGQPSFSHYNFCFLGPHGGGGSANQEPQVIAKVYPETWHRVRYFRCIVKQVAKRREFCFQNVFGLWLQASSLSASFF